MLGLHSGRHRRSGPGTALLTSGASVLFALRRRSGGCCDVNLTKLANLAAVCASRFRPNANLFALLPLQRQTGGETVTVSE